MGIYADTMAEQDEYVKSPDGLISARLTAGGIRGIQLAPGAYKLYKDRTMEEQLMGLAKLMFVARRKQRRRSLQAAQEITERPRERTFTSSKERRMKEEHDKCTVTVHNAHIDIKVVGGLKWSFRIKPGTLREVPEQEFLTELKHGVARAILEWRVKQEDIRHQIYGPGISLLGYTSTAR